MFLIWFEILIPILQNCTSTLTKVVSNDSLNRSLWSIWTAKGELIIGDWNLNSATLQCVHAEWNTEVVAFSILIVLRCCYIPVDNCLVIQQFEIPRIMTRVLVECRSVNFPGRANLSCTFLSLLIGSTISEISTGESTCCWFRLANIIFDDHVVGFTS